MTRWGGGGESEKKKLWPPHPEFEGPPQNFSSFCLGPIKEGENAEGVKGSKSKKGQNPQRGRYKGPFQLPAIGKGRREAENRVEV